MTEPRVGCGAAIVRRAEILLIRRLGAPEAATWSLPGGKVDFLETVPNATVREVAEELGIQIGLGPLLGVLDLLDPAGGYHWVSPIYRATCLGGTPRIMEPHKHGAFGWFSLDNLPQPLSASVRFAVERL